MAPSSVVRNERGGADDVLSVRSGPTRYYFYYGGVRHYHGSRTWNQCNGHCDQDIYIDQATFNVYYAPGSFVSPGQAVNALQAVWPTTIAQLVTATFSTVGGPHMSYSVLLPDGTSTASFSNAVRNCVALECANGAASGSCALFTVSGATAFCPQTTSVSVMQVATQAESDGAALTLPSMIVLVLSALWSYF